MGNKKFAALACPLIIQSVLLSIFNVTDAVMLGMLQTDLLSAVTMANQIPLIYNVILIAFSLGCTALSAQYYGSGDTESVRKVMYLTLQATGILSLLLFLACFLCPEAVMLIYTDQRNIVELGIPYLRIISVTFLMMGFSQVCMNVLKNIGSEKKTALIGSIGAVLNIILDALLIFGLCGFPKLGIRGAAAATVISRGVEFILTLIMVLRSGYLDFKFGNLFRSYKTFQRKYFRYTLPSVAQSGSWMIATSMTVSILGHLGPEITAANSAAVNLYNIFTGVANGYSNAVGITIGTLLGSNELEKAKRTGSRLLKLSLPAALLCFGGFLAALPLMLRLNSDIPPLAVRYLRVIIVFLGVKFAVKFFNTVLSLGILSAGGDIRYMMKVDIINMWGIVLPLGFICGFVLKLPPLIVFAVLNMDQFTKVCVEYRRYKRYIWAKNLTVKEWAEPGRYEDQLRKRIFDEMPLGVIAVEGNGKISMCNDEFARILDKSTEELLGLPVSCLISGSSDHSELVDMLIDAVMDKKVRHQKVIKSREGRGGKALVVCTRFIEDEEYKQGVYMTIMEMQ